MTKVVAGMFQPEFAGEFRTFRPRPDKTQRRRARRSRAAVSLVQSEAAKVVPDSRAARIVWHGPNGTQMALGIFMLRI